MSERTFEEVRAAVERKGYASTDEIASMLAERDALAADLAAANERAKATESDLEHQSERRVYWRERAETAERERDARRERKVDLGELTAELGAMEAGLARALEREQVLREAIRQAVILIRAGFDTEVNEGLALLDAALSVSGQPASEFVDEGNDGGPDGLGA